jgi:hypothetical protein
VKQHGVDKRPTFAGQNKNNRQQETNKKKHGVNKMSAFAELNKNEQQKQKTHKTAWGQHKVSFCIPE